MMKKLLFSAVVVAAAGVLSQASAADLGARYTKAPPMMVALYDWSGFYIGGNGGYGRDRDCRTNVTNAAGLGCYNPSGGVAGGQIGYRWQSGAWVYGLEGQGDWANLKGSTQNIANPLNTISNRMDAFGLFTGQFGYAWNNTLLYVKGGASVTDRKYDFTANATGIIGSTTGYGTRVGGTVGVGLEYGFTPNWSLAFEYDHIFESTHGVGFTSTTTGIPLAGTFTSGGDTDLFTARINYKWGGPVIAKY